MLCSGNYDADPPMGGPIPAVYGECFKNLSTSKLSFNRVCSVFSMVSTSKQFLMAVHCLLMPSCVFVQPIP